MITRTHFTKNTPLHAPLHAPTARRVRQACGVLGVIGLGTIATACGERADESQRAASIATIDEATTSDATAAAPTGASIAVTSGPESSTIDRWAEFAFASSLSEMAIECRVDDSDFEACTSPIFYPDVGEGTHTFDVRAAGSTGIDSTYAWEVLDLWENPTSDLIAATKEPDPAAPNSWRGILRINCDFSHSSYDDPIVFPGDEGAAHLHRFYGNTEVDYDTTLSSLYSEGLSTCQGNELNRSAYWVPALLTPDEGSNDDWAPVPAVVGGNDEAHEVFYYSAGVDDLESIQPIPAGLRMIAGDATATPDDPQDFSIVRWHCQSWESNDATNPNFSATIPECDAPDRVRMDIFFPSCWNGVDLDSEDHTSHMAYPERDGSGDMVCPESHPVPIVRPSYHYAFGVKPDVYDPVTQASTGWRLSADSYTVDADNPGGASLHADWFNGWHPSVMEAILETCIQGALDCHDGNLANGFRLSDVFEGVQNDPDVINDGLGTMDHDGHGGHGDEGEDSDGTDHDDTGHDDDDGDDDGGDGSPDDHSNMGDGETDDSEQSTSEFIDDAALATSAARRVST